jgi:hypothetical protein
MNQNCLEAIKIVLEFFHSTSVGGACFTQGLG